MIQIVVFIKILQRQGIPPACSEILGYKVGNGLNVAVLQNGVAKHPGRYFPVATQDEINDTVSK